MDLLYLGNEKSQVFEYWYIDSTNKIVEDVFRRFSIILPITPLCTPIFMKKFDLRKYGLWGIKLKEINPGI